MYKILLDLLSDNTSIIVSHRLPICQLCNKIIVMDKGEIKEIGSHEELIKKDGLYKKMYKEQASLYI